MTNFIDPKPYINKSSNLPVKQSMDKSKAIKDAVAVIRENKRVIEASSSKPAHENLHR